MEFSDNQQIVGEIVAALANGDWKVLADHPGMQDTRARFPLIKAAFPDLTIEIVLQLEAGDRVATRATLRGTHLGEFMGAPPTGKWISADILMIDQVQAARIVEHVAIADWLSILGPLGLIRPIDPPG